jgi:hypothetical protein
MTSAVDLANLLGSLYDRIDELEARQTALLDLLRQVQPESPTPDADPHA